MADSLNVIALISGGKDSFYSLLHCLQNGHNVVALGNLYPPLPPACPLASHRAEGVDDRGEEEEEEHDLNSFMYQTVGHTVIPLYEQALGIPLYRQEIRGSAVQTALSYRFQGPAQDAVDEVGQNEEDETESLVPLLKRIIAAHPEVNALSTGAILSTYQRTRIESIALRFGLTPLAYLWQYPLLPPGTQSSLLGDMESVGLDARIVKVASAGLDEMFLWENVADPRVVSRIERSMGRFGMSGDGAVLGEGGEFETLTIDGPRSLFRGKIVVGESMKKVIREGGGSAWLRILGASVVMKEEEEALEGKCRTPDLLGKKFKECLDFIAGSDMDTALPGLERLALESTSKPEVFSMPSGRELQNDILHWTVQKEAHPNDTISTQAKDLVDQIRTLLHGSSLESTSIVSTVIMLRSMADFGAINQIYSTLFPSPNPPARVTISCGSCLPTNINIVIHLRVHNHNSSTLATLQLPERKALHVQSRSYWAPANIGPYSQAIAILLPTPRPSSPDDEDDEESGEKSWSVSIAGQIPLVPQTMVLPAQPAEIHGTEESSALADFRLQTVLSLQHLWRIGIAMEVQWFTYAIAYLPSSSSSSSSPAQNQPLEPDQNLSTCARTLIVAKAWSNFHLPSSSSLEEGGEDDDDDEQNEEERDLWEEKYLAGTQPLSGSAEEKILPDWEIVESTTKRVRQNIPPFFAAEVEELPRGAGVEWGIGLGLRGAKGSIKIAAHISPASGSSIYQTLSPSTLHTLIAIPYTPLLSQVQSQLSTARSVLNLPPSQKTSASYVDTSISSILEMEARDCGGLVLCKSLWDGNGQRLAAVFVFETHFI